MVNRIERSVNEQQIEQLTFIQEQLGQIHQQIEAQGYNVRPELLNGLLALTNDIKSSIENIKAGVGLPPGTTFEELLRRADSLSSGFKE